MEHILNYDNNKHYKTNDNIDISTFHIYLEVDIFPTGTIYRYIGLLYLSKYPQMTYYSEVDLYLNGMNIMK